MDSPIKYVPGMPWRLVDGVRVPDLDAIRACPFPTPYTASQMAPRPTLRCAPDSSETSQEFKDECDINVIMRRFTKTGRLPQLAVPAQYGDYSDVPDYMDALNTVIHAQEAFAELPAKLRERFHHDPGQLLAFLSDTKNRDEAITLGLLNSNPPPKASPTAQADSAPKPTNNDPTKP